VATVTRGFFARLLEYLERVKGTKVERSNAASALARLEGYLILARTMRKRDLFEQVLDHSTKSANSGGPRLGCFAPPQLRHTPARLRPRRTWSMQKRTTQTG
jgi:hypothetical protein